MIVIRPADIHALLSRMERDLNVSIETVLKDQAYRMLYSGRPPSSVSVPMPLPRCAKCGHSIDRLEVETEARTGDRILTAHCHGETEQVRLYFADLVSATQLSPGVAFAAGQHAITGV